MCRRRQVRNVYLKCGHGENLPEEIIPCEQSNCRFSPFHPANCRPPTCHQTCWQYRRFPEQYCTTSSMSLLFLRADICNDSPQHRRVLPFLLTGYAVPPLKNPLSSHH
ncbi:hypothetical protein IW261DRAFT_663191 [Armillaria novae-zelandiae]|uniref:Uncharacterized protein n=1 Tax=Armillaria novae-zelandiae TaxID=153914 RepID=A0AA39NXZ3_9AGAR|nr:hypothetical protein IW261DRAFT_663191 [Armillaria novae-zelandiae]